MTGDVNLLWRPMKEEERSFERNSWEEKQILKSALPPSASLKSKDDGRRKYPAVSHSDLRRYRNIHKKCSISDKKVD